MSLSDSQMARLGELLDEALLLPVAERRAWLETLPSEDQPLFSKLRQALEAQDETRTGHPQFDRLPTLEGNRGAMPPVERHAGERLGVYELLRPLGTGGMAEVWLARRADGVFERQVALKIPRMRNLSAQMTSRFARECQILASLECPGIARLYDAGIDTGGIPYIAMEYVQGESLVEWCDTQGLDAPARIGVFLKVLDAVGHAHAQQVIHRDLKPSNILVTPTGEPRLLDFGVARLLQPDTASASLTHVYGRALTPAYASPEMLRGEPIDLRSDIYSLGVVLHELFTGVRPSTRVTARAQTQPGLLAGLREVLAKALAQAPDDRFADAAQFAAALQPFAAGGRPRHTLARGRYLLAAALAVVATAGVLAVVLLDGVAGVEQRDPAALRAPVALAVMPFANLSSDPEQEFFSDGLAEEILNQLAQFQGLDVRARTSSFAFKGRHEDVATIGRQLNVAYLLQGSVRKADQKVRITAQLVLAAEASQVWSKTYDGELQDVFTLQEKVARDVGTALSVTLDVGDLSRASGGTTNLAAYEKFLQARSELARGDSSGEDKALALLREAVQLDPGFGAAWVVLSQTLYGLPGSLALRPAEVERELARILAYNAQAAPGAPWTKHLQAYDHFAHYRWAQAAAAVAEVTSTAYGSRRIVDAFANPPIDLKWLRLFEVGRVAEAFELSDAWARTDPLNLYASTVKMRLLPYVGRSAEQRAEYERSQGLEGSHRGADLVVLMNLLGTEGVQSAAVREQFAVVARGSGEGSLVRRVFDRLDDHAAALAVLRAALNDPQVGRLNIALLADGFGDRELALDAVRMGVLDPYWRGPFSPGYALWYPYRTGLRSDPRFKALLREIGLVQYWQDTGNWGDFCRPLGADDFECR